ARPGRPPGERPGPRRGAAGAGTPGRADAPPGAALGRRRLRGPAGGLGARGGRLGAGDRGEASRRDDVRRPAQAPDRGAHLRLAGQVPAPRQGLRALRRLLRGPHPPRHDRPHAPPPAARPM
ncbi:MAG: hypothetical protein AVDCRST_MAG19-2813, partial [uncultured Thermomicrobiales bacterium]